MGINNLMMKVISVIFCAILLSSASLAQQSRSGKLENIYKEVPRYEDQPVYWLFVHSNDCSYEIRVNDMPVYTDYNEGSAKSLSFPLNPLLLKSGKQTLNLTLLPKSDNEFRLASTLSKEYSVKIRIVRSENGKDSVVLEKEYRADQANQPALKKYAVSFDADLPYELSGWQYGANLKEEKQSELEKEVIRYYKDIIRDYETRNLTGVEDKYYGRQSEYAECSYLDQPEDSKKLVEELRKDLDKKQDFELEHYKLQLYGNGKVVSLIRTDGEFRGKSAFLGLTDDNFYIYNLLLYRPSPGAPLEVIR